MDLVEYIKNILSDNIVAVFALLGTIIGASLTFLSSWFLAGRETKLRLREKLLDRRIEAHEQIILLTPTIRTMISLFRQD